MELKSSSPILYIFLALFTVHLNAQKLPAFMLNGRLFDDTTKYFVNNAYTKKQGVHFLYVEGDRTANSERITIDTYVHVALAKTVGATLWSLEHRFYGDSRISSTNTSERLDLLTSQQALEDITYFIKKISPETNSKWVLFGAGYAGSLVLWHRQKYPGVTIGAVSSSGSTVIPTVDFYDYHLNIDNTLKQRNEVCFNNVADAAQLLRHYVQSNESRVQLSSELNLKPALDDTPLKYRDLQLFYHNMASLFHIPIQYNKLNLGVFNTEVSIDKLCEIFTDTDFDALTRLKKWAYYVLMQLTGEFTTPNNYLRLVSYLKAESVDPAYTRTNVKNWLWQSCNEFSYFTTTDNSKVSFGSSLPNNFYINLCTDVFGRAVYIDSIKAGNKKTREYYGSSNVYTGTNVVTTRGGNDPWRTLAPTNVTEDSAIAYVIVGASRSADFQPSVYTDVYGIKFARNLINRKVKGWIDGTGKKNAEPKRSEEFVKHLEPKIIQRWDAKLEYNITLPKKKLPPYAFLQPRNLLQHRLSKLHGSLGPDADVKPFMGAGFIHQDIDHFSKESVGRWKQLFLFNNAWYQKGGPVFVFIGGESELSFGYVSPYLSYNQWARHFGANIYALEHRYYGYSYPVDITGPEDYQYLTSEQALADLALFINSLKIQYDDPNLQVVVFGNLAAWFRLKYPSLTVGAVASSAPVQTKVDFYEYLQVVENSTQTFGGIKCVSAVHEYFAWWQRNLNTIKGRKKISSFWCLCDEWDEDFISDKDAELLMANVVFTLAAYVQYDDEKHSYMEAICDSFDYVDKIIDKNKAEEVQEAAYIKISRMLRNHHKELMEPNDYSTSSEDNGGGDGGDTSDPDSNPGRNQCGGDCDDFSYEYLVDVFQTYIFDDKSWYWQVCTELGVFQTSNFGYNIFESALPVNFMMDLCTDIFGMGINRQTVDAAVDFTNQNYGGQDNYNGTNVVFVNGSEDPWHVQSVYKIDPNVNVNVSSILIDGTSHCEDMYRGEAFDREVLKAARRKIRAQLIKWLT